MITANVAGSAGGSGHPPPSFHSNRATHLTPGARAWVRSHSQLNLYGGGGRCERRPFSKLPFYSCLVDYFTFSRGIRE